MKVQSDTGKWRSDAGSMSPKKLFSVVQPHSTTQTCLFLKWNWSNFSKCPSDAKNNTALSWNPTWITQATVRHRDQGVMPASCLCITIRFTSKQRSFIPDAILQHFATSTVTQYIRCIMVMCFSKHLQDIRRPACYFGQYVSCEHV